MNDKSHMSEKEMDQLFDAIDADRSGTIEDSELLTHLIKHGHNEDTMAQLFRELDADRDGHITRAEWRQGYSKFIKQRSAREAVEHAVKSALDTALREP